jgi:hypothetical protein
LHYSSNLGTPLTADITSAGLAERLLDDLLEGESKFENIQCALVDLQKTAELNEQAVRVPHLVNPSPQRKRASSEREQPDAFSND